MKEHEKECFGIFSSRFDSVWPWTNCSGNTLSDFTALRRCANLNGNQVCLGIFFLSALALVAGAMNFIYQIERMPLMVAILIHGGVLYICYLATYLINGWLQDGVTPILVFTGIFVLGYLVIWAIIYFIIKKRTERINEILKEKQRR